MSPGAAPVETVCPGAPVEPSKLEGSTGALGQNIHSVYWCVSIQKFKKKKKAQALEGFLIIKEYISNLIKF